MRLPICRSDWLADWPIGEIGRLADWMLPSGALEVTKVLLFIVFPIRFAFSTCRSYQICYAFSSCALEVTKESLLPFPPVLRLRSYQSVGIYCFFHPTCSLEVTKVSPLSFSSPACALEITKVLSFIGFPADLRPRSYQSVSYCRVPFLSCALEVPKCRCFLFSRPDLRLQGYQSFPWRPRSYQSVIVS